MEADAQITLCAISVGGLIPADAMFKVEVTNNGKDSSPVWEDATTEARNGRNHLFTNQTATNGFAFNFRVTAERGASGERLYRFDSGRFPVMGLKRVRVDSVAKLQKKKTMAELQEENEALKTKVSFSGNQPR